MIVQSQKITLKGLVSFLLFFLLMLILLNWIVYLMAKDVCIETQTVPIRYEIKGFWGTKVALQTTIDNMDEMGKVCTRYGEPRLFDLSYNLEFIANSLK